MRIMNEAFDRFLKDCVPLMGVRTQREYARHVAALRPHFGDRVICEVKPRDIGRFLDVETGKIHRNKQVTVLSAVFGKCLGKWYADDLDSNPCSKVERHASHPRTRYITDQEFNAVRAVVNPPFALAMDLALLTGQRQGDLLDLTWHNVHSDHVQLSQSKTGKLMGIRITSALADVLQRCRQYNQFKGPRLYLLRTKTGEPFTHEGFRSQWQVQMNRAMPLAGLRTRFTFHDIRAKCASDKQDLNSASALLGHDELGMTDRVYIRGLRLVDPLR